MATSSSAKAKADPPSTATTRTCFSLKVNTKDDQSFSELLTCSSSCQTAKDGLTERTEDEDVADSMERMSLSVENTAHGINARHSLSSHPITTDAAPGRVQNNLSTRIDGSKLAEGDEDVHGIGSLSLECSQAREKVKHFFEESTLKEVNKDLPTFHNSELRLGKYLGRGANSDVDEIIGVQAAESRPTMPRRTNSLKKLLESRDFFASHCIRPSGLARYAIKRLRRNVVKDPQRCWSGIIDLVVETRFLINLEHPNIIKVHGAAACDPFSKDYFLVLDRLHSTLQKRLKEWSWRQQKSKTLLSRLRDPKGIKRAHLLEERLAAAFDLSAAIEYMVSFFSRVAVVLRDCAARVS
jgi:hypothetical protein